MEPGVTVASVTTPAKNNDHNPRVASETAPAWNVRDILQPVLPSIKDAVKEIVPYLEVMPDSLHAALRELAVRDEYTCHLCGVEQPAEDSRGYHATTSRHDDWLHRGSLLADLPWPAYMMRVQRVRKPTQADADYSQLFCFDAHSPLSVLCC